MVLNDRTEHYLNDEQTVKVNQALAKSGDGFIILGTLTVKKSAVQQIKPGGRTQADIFEDPWAEEDHQIEAPKKCIGCRSISLEILNTAKKQSQVVSDQNPDGLKAYQLIADKDWREMIRLERYEQTEKWCDQSTGKCYCHEQ
jgi:hypothetical protein